MKPPPSPDPGQLRAALADIEDAARRALRDGREVVGTFSPLAPPAEIIEAAGAHPYRLLMNAGADADLRGMGILGRDTCSFCRSVIGTAIAAPAPVTCVASGTACDRLRRMEDAWADATGIPLYTVALPRTRTGEHQVDPVARELRLLAGELSHRTGTEVTEDRLTLAIETGNRCREALAQLDLLRRPDPPLLTGAEFLDVVRAHHGLPAARFLPLARAMLAEVAGRERGAVSPVRLLLMGPTLLDGAREVVDVAEQTGRAVVVADLTDSGALGYGSAVPTIGDPFENLARQVLDHPILAAPTRPATPLRGLTVRTVADTGIDGVLFRSVPFCRPWNFEPTLLRDLLPVPLLDVRVDGNAGRGQIATRVGAFVESLWARKRTRAGS